MNVDHYDKEIVIITNYIDMKRYSHALEHLSSLLEEWPSDAYLIYLHAYCLYRLDRYEEAMESCQYAVDGGYNLDECYCLFSRIHTQRGNYNEAESCLLAALEISPRNGDFLAFYGYLMLLSNKNYRALELINQALELEPENLNALHYKFYYYLNMDDNHGIKSKLVERYFSLSTDESDRFLKAALLDYHDSKYESAEENFRQAFRLDPTNRFVLGMLKKISRKPRFIYYWGRRVRSGIMKKLGPAYAFLKANWILFKCVGLTRDTVLFIAVPAVLLLLGVTVMLIVLF